MTVEPADGIHIRTCPLCEAMCGLKLTVEEGRVTKIRANDDDVWSKGYICPKGTALHHLHDDPERLRTPLVRNEDGSFREVGWNEAFTEIERLLKPIVESFGSEAVATYIGNPTAHNFSLSRYIGAFINMSGITNIYSAGTVDQWPKNLTCALMYGGSWTVPIPDIDRTDFMLMLGANPFASQGSLLAAPDVIGRLRAIQQRGGKFIVVDPRKTGTAKRADEWIPIQPGTDAALLLGMVNVLFADELVDLKELESIVDGVGTVQKLCSEFTPEYVEGICRIPADRIRSLAREFSDAEHAVVYGRIGTCTQEFGTLASWLVEVLNILTGNLDRPGGSMFSNPIAWSMLNLRPPEFKDGFEIGRFKSRVRGADEILGQFPASCLHEEIATPGEGQLKALITIAGNPVLSTPEGDRLDEALDGLQCMVSVDNWLNETTRHAHVILPGSSSLEQPHYDEMQWSWAVRSAGKYSPALYGLPEDRPREWNVLLRLAALAQGQDNDDIDLDMIDDFYFVGLIGMLTDDESSSIYDRDPDDIAAEHPTRGPERILDFAIRTGPFGDAYGTSKDGLTLEQIEQRPNGVDFGPMVPRIAELLATPSGKIDLAPEHICADLPRLRKRIERGNDELVLISRRQLRSNNSWMHNVAPLMTGKDRCTLLVHPEDADAAGLAEGQVATVTSSSGTLDAPVEVSDEMMPGVVCLPHGFGHNKEGTRLSVASERPGVNSNVLSPGTLLDVPSGNAVVNGIPVTIRRR